MTKATGKRVLLKYPEVIKAVELLRQHGTRNEATGIYSYADGWSDGRVRDQVNPALPIERIIDLRESNFGRLELADGRTLGRRHFLAKFNAMAADIDDVKSRLAALEKDLGVAKPQSVQHSLAGMLGTKFKVTS